MEKGKKRPFKENKDESSPNKIKKYNDKKKMTGKPDDFKSASPMNKQKQFGKPFKPNSGGDKKFVKSFKPNATGDKKFSKSFKSNTHGQKNGNSTFDKNKSDKLEPPNWVEFKKKKKELRETRRVAKAQPDTHDVISRAKVISEKLRRKKGSVEERAKLTDELHNMLHKKGHYKKFALAHDTTRIIQWLLKFATPKVREELSKELMSLIVEMIQSKYARNCVKRILKYGSPAVRVEVLDVLQGHVVKLASHALSAPILDYAYTEMATKKQKIYFQQEFYGDIYKTNKDDSVQCLADTYKKSPEMKGAMLGATKANVLRVLNKNVHDCGLLHDVLYDLLKECSSDDKSELITTLSPLVAPLSNSKQGVKVAAMCVWHGTNKDKKVILKVVKEHVVPLSTHEHGHLLILAILSSVDDTVLVGKVLVSTLLKDAAVVAKEEWGRKVLLWLVAPEDKAYFHPALVQWLTTGASQGSSKKPSNVRAAELLELALPSLCSSLQDDASLWLNNGSIGLLTLAIIKAASGESLTNSLDSVSKIICQPEWKLTEDDKEVNGIEHAGIHLCLKKIAQHDKVNTERQLYTFGEAVSKELNENIAHNWITTNRGCFFLITLFENNSAVVQKSLTDILHPIMKKLKKQTTAGAKILLSKLKG